jgi:hypothetical protein
MEYQGWTQDRAFLDMKAQGFGAWVCTSANDYVKQYVTTYQPRVKEKNRDCKGGAGVAIQPPPYCRGSD